MSMTALGIDVMLPAFPEVREAFGMAPDATQVGWIITAYFLGMAAGPWLYGPASDRYGRRAPLLAGLAVYIVASMACAVAPSWPMLVAARFVWGIGAAGPRALAVAMIRDRYHGSEMARLMSMVMAIFLIVPILAPLAGAAILHISSWRWAFGFPAIVAAALALWSALRLGETLPEERRRPFTVRAVGEGIRAVGGNRQTLAMVVAMTCLFGALNAYISSFENIMGDVFDRESWFPYVFASVGVLLAANSLSNAELVRRFGVVSLLRRVSVVALVTTVVLTLVSLTNGGRPNFWLFLAVLAVCLPLLQGLSPNSNTLAMEPVPHVAGTAAAIITTVTSAIGAVLGAVSNAAFDGTARPFAVTLLILTAVTAASIHWGTRQATI